MHKGGGREGGKRRVNGIPQNRFTLFMIFDRKLEPMKDHRSSSPSGLGVYGDHGKSNQSSRGTWDKEQPMRVMMARPHTNQSQVKVDIQKELPII